MTDAEAALAYLKEQFGEGWECSLQLGGKGWFATADRIRPDPPDKHNNPWMFIRCWGDDPMSAARACVEAAKAADIVSVEVVSGLRECIEAERALADRLAEPAFVLAKFLPALSIRGNHPRLAEVRRALDQLGKALAAYDARRGKEGA